MSNRKFMQIWIFRITQRVAFSSGVNHGVIYKVIVFQLRKHLAKNALVKITLIFLINQDEEIISWKLLTFTKTRNSETKQAKHVKPPKWPKQKDWNETNLTTKTTENKNYQNSIPKKLIKIQWMPWGFRRQPSYSSGLARLWSTPDLPHGEIPLSI